MYSVTLIANGRNSIVHAHARGMVFSVGAGDGSLFARI